MAITRINTTSGTYASASGLSYPITAQTGDVTVLVMHAASQFFAPTTPTGWTLLDNLSGSGNYAYMYWTRWTTNGGTFEQNNPYLTDLVIHQATYRGVDAGVDPFNQHAIADLGTDTTPAVALGSQPADSVSIGVMMGNPSTSATRTYTAGAGQTRLTHQPGSTTTNYNGGAMIEHDSTAAGSRTLTGSVSSALTNILYASATLLMATANTAPVITSQPTIAYTGTHAVGTASALTRLGPSNTATINMVATDAHQTGAGALSYQVRTSATPGAGTLVTSGTMTTGVNPAISLNDGMPGLTTSGSHALYVHVLDGEFTTVTNSFVVNVDVTSPVITNVTPPATELYGFTGYSVDLTFTDTHSINAGELFWHIRTGAGGTGTLLTYGTATSATPFTTDEFDDPTLASGTNTRYVRVEDGGGNITETSYTVDYLPRDWDQIQGPVIGADDGYFQGTAAATTTSDLFIVGWNASSTNYSSFMRFPLNAESSFQIDYTEIRQKVSTVYAGAVTMRVQAVKELNPAAVASGADWNSRPKTDAYVEWDANDWTTLNKIVRTPDLSPIIEELIAQPGWTAGNNIVLVFSTPTTYSSTTQQRRATAQENADVYPQLYVDWTEGEHYVETDGSVETLVSTSGTDLLGTQYNEEGGLTSLIAVVSDGTHALTIVETGSPSTVGVVTTTDVHTFNMADLDTVVEVGVEDGGTDQFTYGHVSTTANIVQVVSQGSESQIYNELLTTAAEFKVEMDANDIYEPYNPGPQTYEEYNTGPSVRVVSSYSVEQQYFNYRELTGSVLLTTVEDASVESMISNETFGTTVVRAVTSHSVEFKAFQYKELTGTSTVGVTSSGAVEKQYFNYIETTNPSVVGVVEGGLDGFIVTDISGISVIGTFTDGQEFIPIVEVGDLSEILAVTEGTDYFAIGHADVYLPIDFQTYHPYNETTFEGTQEYQTSSFLSTNIYNETTFRVTKV